MRKDTADIVRNRELDATPRTLMGWYMPFPGVRYYKFLTDIDIALERGGIGPVGWRDEKPVDEAEPRKPVAV